MNIANGAQPKRVLIVGKWNHAGEAERVRPARHLAREGHAAESDWRRQADEGGCADWGLAYARIQGPPARPKAKRGMPLLRTIAQIVAAAAATALLIIGGHVA